MPRDVDYRPNDERYFKREERLARMEEERLERGPSGLPPSAPVYDDRSERRNKAWNGMAAPFVEKEDQIPLLLLHSLQKKKPWRNYQGFQLLDIIQSDEIMVWADEVDALICFVGQNMAKNKEHLIDDLNIAGVAGKESCALRLARVGKEIIDQVHEMGKVITLCGFSLGGATVACLVDDPRIDRGVIFNPGAPLTNAPRVTPKKCTAYHIVGDIISTHFTECTRIYLLEAYVRVNQSNRWLQSDGIQWMDVPYYHDLDRFLDLSAPYEIVDAQFEQNSLENFLFFKRGNFFDIFASIAGALSVEFNFRRKLQLQICSNPVPGATPSRGCKEGGPKDIDKVIGGVLGAAVGAGAALFGTGGTALVPATAGGAAAGQALATGEKGLLDLFQPDIVRKAVDVKDKIIQGASDIQAMNTSKGVWTSQIVEGPPPEFAQGGLLQKIK